MIGDLLLTLCARGATLVLIVFCAVVAYSEVRNWINKNWRG